MAILTIRLHRQALSEAGETFLHRPLVVMFCVGAPFATVPPVPVPAPTPTPAPPAPAPARLTVR